MGVSDHRSRFIALGRIRRRRGSSMVMPSLKSGSGAARRRFWLAMSGFVMALALMPFSYKVERRLETAAHIKGGESEKVDKELAQRFQSPYAHRLVVAISGIPDPDSAESADALSFLTSSLRGVPGVSGAVSSLDWPDPLFTGNNGGGLVILGVGPPQKSVGGVGPVIRGKKNLVGGPVKAPKPQIQNGNNGETTPTLHPSKVNGRCVQ